MPGVPIDYHYYLQGSYSPPHLEYHMVVNSGHLGSLVVGLGAHATPTSCDYSCILILCAMKFHKAPLR